MKKSTVAEPVKKLLACMQSGSSLPRSQKHATEFLVQSTRSNRGVASDGRVMQSPRQKRPSGGKNEYFKEEKNSVLRG